MDADDLSAEQWRPVVGFAALYEVSQFGHVRSLCQSQGRGKSGRRVPILIAQRKNFRGYYRVMLYDYGHRGRAGGEVIESDWQEQVRKEREKQKQQYLLWFFTPPIGMSAKTKLIPEATHGEREG